MFGTMIILLSFVIVKEGERAVVERMGAYHHVLGVGLHFVVPLFDRVKARVSIKEQCVTLQKTTYLTKEDAKVDMITHVYFMVRNPKLFVYGIEEHNNAISSMTKAQLVKLLYNVYVADIGQCLCSRYWTKN